MQHETSVQELVYRSCLLLDDKAFGEFLDLCAPEFRYRITAYSPEIRKDMTFLEHDKEELRKLFDTLPKHNSDRSPLSRHATVCTVTFAEDRASAEVVSRLQVFKTSLDGGVTELFGVGRIYDVVKTDGATPRLLDRSVRLDTRMLGLGSQIPL